MENTGGSFGFPPLSILPLVRALKPIWLVGMMGAGKSTVGPALAVRLGLPFLDTDREIVRQSGREIEKIFAEEGESVFRALEAEVIAKLAGEPAVVALGGGAIAPPGAAQRLASLGTLVYLWASPEELLRRVGEASSRPLLRGLDPDARLARLRALLSEREVGYRGARIRVETDGATVEEIVDELVERIGLLEAGRDEAR